MVAAETLESDVADVGAKHPELQLSFAKRPERIVQIPEGQRVGPVSLLPINPGTAPPAADEPLLEGSRRDEGMGILERSDHSFENAEELFRCGVLHHSGTVRGDDRAPIRVLQREERIVLGPGLREGFEVRPGRIRRRLVADRRPPLDAPERHVRSRPTDVDPHPVRIGIGQK
jgi:hypothetical protein